MWELVVCQLHIASVLFNWVKLWVELWEEKSGETAFLAAHLKRGFDSGKVRLVEKEAAATTVDAILRTLKVLALCIKPCLSKKSSFLEDYCHALEDSGLWVSLGKVGGLQLTVWGNPVGHPNPLLHLLLIRAINRAALFICCINFHQPGCLLFWLLWIRLQYILGHVSGREGAWCLFCVDSGIVENENVIIISIVLLKNVHCIIFRANLN